LQTSEKTMLEYDVGSDPFHSRVPGTGQAWSIEENLSLDVCAFEGKLMTDKAVQRGNWTVSEI
jgi:hypothetical protein